MDEARPRPRGAAYHRAVTCFLIALVTCASCAGPSSVGAIRFANQAPVWRVNDRLDVPKQPRRPPFSRMLYFFDVLFVDQVTEAMSVALPRHAINVNSLDEVPDSTWFTNRIGTRDVTPADVARGPSMTGEPQTPLTITSSKVGGRSIGFIARDARGDRFIIKFDERDFPVLETAADVVVQRLLWAVGYNVPEDSVVYFRRADLVMDDDAEIKDSFGNARPMTVKDINDNLAQVDKGPDGRYRALASRFLPGVPIGGFPLTGVRADDPNDRVPHEHRREIRGLYVFYSWLQATDVKLDNTLDVWTTDPRDPSRRYVVHYLVDFGKSLGANGTIPRFAADGYAPQFDFPRLLYATFGLALYRRPWDGMRDPGIRGVGWLDAAHYQPDKYRPQQPYRPFDFTDRFDRFWAAKIVMRLSPAHIRAAVEQGKYDDPRAVDYLTDTLVARQRKLARAWFDRVTPLDRFEVSTRGQTWQLCFDDLSVKYGLLDGDANTTWRAAAYDYAGEPLGWRAPAQRAMTDSTACVHGIPMAPDTSRYTIVQVQTRRGAKALLPVDVHVAAAPGRMEMRVIGVYRH